MEVYLSILTTVLSPLFFSPQVAKTVWEWELMNDIKPIWQRPAKEVEEDEYKAFYKTFSRVGVCLEFIQTRSPSRY